MDRKAFSKMIFVPGGTFRTGSDRHYLSEPPAHRATVDTFRIEMTPVTNAQFRAFVRASAAPVRQR